MSAKVFLKMLKSILPYIAFIASCNAAFFTPEGLCTFDVNTFTGGWFEIASSNNVSITIEAGCKCPVSYYTTVGDSKNVSLTNSCIRNDQFWSVNGTLAAPNGGKPQGGLFATIGNANATSTPNYIVLKQWFTEKGTPTAPQYALVGGSDENWWWLIGRSPLWNMDVWYNAVYVLQAHEYNITGYASADQSCQFIGGHGRNLIPSPSSA